ncbi:nuclease domain-containing protein [Spathaspora sp. JA1]|nr:nuclease domain-containing protein [Spathaspora sp. JA1]
MSFLVAKVKNVLSPDTVVLIPSKTTQCPAPERLFTLSYIRGGDDFESKEFVRNLLIGKDIKFKVIYKAANREFGDIQSPIFKSLIEYLLKNGVVKLKENFNENEGDIFYELTDAENYAKSNGLGVWSTTQEKIELINLDEKIITKSQKYPFKLIVEKCISGDRIVGRIIVNKNQHVSSSLLLAGIKCPRTDDAQQAANITKVGHQAKQFVEEKLLTTKAELKVSIIGENQTGIPIVTIIHPSGNNIHEKLLEAGLGEVVDWQSTLIGSSIMVNLRKAEQTARALGKGLFANPHATSKPAIISQTKSLKPGITLENVTIAKVVGADTLVLRLHNDEEITVQLASIRAPRLNDTTVTTDSQKQHALVATAKEFVRHQVIGKTGTVYIDGYRNENKDLGLEARFLVSFKTGNVDLSESLVTNGFATVIKHNKATQHERSLNWDKLIELEEEAKKTGKKGIYGDLNKVLTVSTRIIDTSENFTKAKTFFNGFKQKGRIGGYYVEFVSSINRVRLFHPREGLKLTLILGGLSNSKTDALGEEGLKLLNKRFLQRPVEFEIYDTDKLGGFIGNLYANANSLAPIQVTLLEQGLIKVHEFAINANPLPSKLIQAEESAKSNKKGIWSDYDPVKVERDLQESNEKLQQLNLDASKPKFFDIEVVDVDSTGIISFHLLDSTTIQKFTQFKNSFSQFHAQIPSASTNSSDLPFNLTRGPKKNEIVSAKFTENNKYYRAKVLNFDKASNKYEVKHLDYGNVDKVPLSSLRTLPVKFNTTTIPAFAHTTTLQNLKLPPSDYLTDAIYALEDLVFDKKLVISALPGVNTEYEGILYDSEQSLKDPSYTINKQLVHTGWAIVDNKLVKPAVKSYVDELIPVQNEAKVRHLGCWEFGDVSFDDEEAI